MNTTQTCEGTTGKLAVNHYGRKICDTCGNSVLPKANGDLRKHKAIPYAYPYTLVADTEPDAMKSDVAKKLGRVFPGF